jgi:hypothetical protein
MFVWRVVNQRAARNGNKQTVDAVCQAWSIDRRKMGRAAQA